jgi:hypothetical protein
VAYSFGSLKNANAPCSLMAAQTRVRRRGIIIKVGLIL